jgi:aspartate-semialdehyde dehydrogenase
MTATFDIAILGATGAVGEAMLSILAERQFPVGKLYPLASEKSAGQKVSFADSTLTVKDVAKFDFSKVQIALFSAGGSVSAQYAPIAAEAGCVVIDNTSHFRNDPDIPLVIPEVNATAIADYRTRNIIANPNCSTIQMLVALKPIYDAVGILRVNVATYQSVSGAGRSGVEELELQARQLLNGQTPKPEKFTAQIAFNVIPQIDTFEDNGYTREEMKMFWETQKILGDYNIQVNATAVRVPVFYGHSEAIHIETRDKITVDDAKAILKQAPGIIFVDDPLFPTPLEEGTSEDAVFVGRVREDFTHPCGLNMWVVSDNVRKGAALNAVQIAELLVEEWLNN